MYFFPRGAEQIEERKREKHARSLARCCPPLQGQMEGRIRPAARKRDSALKITNVRWKEGFFCKLLVAEFSISTSSLFPFVLSFEAPKAQQDMNGRATSSPPPLLLLSPPLSLFCGPGGNRPLSPSLLFPLEWLGWFGCLDGMEGERRRRLPLGSTERILECCLL